MNEFIKFIKLRSFNYVNLILPKKNRVLVIGSLGVETNAIEIANYIALKEKKRVFFMSSIGFKKEIKGLLSAKVVIVDYKSYYYYYLMLTSKYIFSTHANLLVKPSKTQITVNIWHGLFYKNINKLRNKEGVDATYTVGTSPLSQIMFSEAFGVQPESVLITGYPRNDLMLRSQMNRSVLKENIRPSFNQYKKILIWLPTYRRVQSKKSASFGMELDNPFQIDNFDAVAFNKILSDRNAICLVKPHYFYTENNNLKDHSNIIFIDDSWLTKQKITLYHLLSCSDILISDYSSVIIDFLLLERPVVCFATDIEEYKRTQGLYFENLEDWLPTKLIDRQQDFFDFIEYLLLDNKDPYEEKREKLKKEFFTYNDENSSKRITDLIFKK